MPSFFSVVRFVPDLVAEEHVNIGVIVVDGDGASCHFVKDWSRAAALSGARVDFLKEVARDLELRCSGLFREVPAEGGPLTRATLVHMSSEWINSVHITAPRGSMRDRDQLLEQCVRDFLKQSPRKPKPDRASKLQAVTIGKRALRRAIDDLAIDLDLAIVDKDLAVVQGAKVPHHFDFGVKNGVIKIAGFGLSFDKLDEEAVNSDIDRIALAVIDVRERLPQMPIGVVALNRTQDHPAAFKRADVLLGDNGASLLRSDEDAEEWSHEAVKVLAAK